ncbi:MAG: hypothetical protein GY704_15075, partial [Phycisphaeraceae bacterium]|nr:hypothetical protein [Phycisphaeraceae bacterium]
MTILVLFWLACALAALADDGIDDADRSEILFVDGTTVNGLVRAMAPSRYIVQGRIKGEPGTGDVAFEVSGDLISRIDGKSSLPSFDPKHRIVANTWFERIRPTGAVEKWQARSVRNDSRNVITWTSWGVA